MKLLTPICFLIFVFNVVSSTELPNIILVLTDDQDLVLNSMVSLEKVQRLIGDSGVTFKNAFVNTPICCPSRSSILTGKLLHNTGVRNNSLTGNCSSTTWQETHEPHSVASILKRNGYLTFYAGKYLNQYGDPVCGGTKHVPDGYDWWLGLKGNSKYYNYTLSINGTAESFTNDYLTDRMNNYALMFLNQKTVHDNPFFMILSTPACHAPFTSAPRHQDAFPKVKASRTPSFNYTSSDKHWLLSMPPRSLPSNVDKLDTIQRLRLQTLLAVDEMVMNIILKLQSDEMLHNTYIIFTSDNGYHIGQFIQPWDKRQPYETDIRVPLLIRGPNIKHNQETDLPVSAIDLAPTILDMANITIPTDMDGTSFLKSISFDNIDSNTQIKEKNILIEYFGEGNSNSNDKDCPWIYDSHVTQCRVDSWCKCQDSQNNTYSCVRRISHTINFKFCRFLDDLNFFEAYDLKNDPYELNNIYKNMEAIDMQDYQRTLDKLLHCKGKSCAL